MEYKPGRCLLKYRLKQIGKNQQWLAEKINMSKAQISNYANNVTPMGLGTAKTIAVILDCSIEDLYQWKITPIKRNPK
jgi:transcriptional regulator with XRE-family HTH domain